MFMQAVTFTPDRGSTCNVYVQKHMQTFTAQVGKNTQLG